MRSFSNTMLPPFSTNFQVCLTFQCFCKRVDFSDSCYQSVSSLYIGWKETETCLFTFFLCLLVPLKGNKKNKTHTTYSLCALDA